MNGHRIDESREEAKTLSAWLHLQAEFYKKHAPACFADILNFRDSAALLDSYQAGLELVTPHPTMRAELIQWVAIQDALPDDEITVLIFTADDPLGEPWPGFHRGGEWFAADGMPLGRGVTHWADMPTGPKPVAAIPADVAEAQAA